MGDTLHIVYNKMVQMHGDIGITDAHDACLYLKRVFFFQAEDGIRYLYVTGVQTCALPIFRWSSFLRGSDRVVLTAGMSPRVRPGEAPASIPIPIPATHSSAALHYSDIRGYVARNRDHRDLPRNVVATKLDGDVRAGVPRHEGPIPKRAGSQAIRPVRGGAGWLIGPAGSRRDETMHGRVVIQIILALL